MLMGLSGGALISAQRERGYLVAHYLFDMLIRPVKKVSCARLSGGANAAKWGYLVAQGEVIWWRTLGYLVALKADKRLWHNGYPLPPVVLPLGLPLFFYK